MIRQPLHRTAALLFVAAVLAFTVPDISWAGDELFPVFPEIQANVDFWKDIYSRYDLSQAVIHDKYDLGIVYEVVDLLPPDSYRARKKNRRKIKKVKKHFRKILLKLADKGVASNPEEQRILNLFGANPSRGKLKESAGNIRSQLGQRDRFRNGIIRSGAFIDRVRKIFREEGVPEDLAYLAHVESSYNVNAYSKYGAAGIWQFTRSTGKKYLTIDYTIDERRDPLIASRAAARLLLDNYQELGSWPLAITAYNHGCNGMNRAKDQCGSYQEIFKTYDGRGFGFASKNFYSEFLAAREVAGDHTTYFGDLHMESPWPFREVEMDGFADSHKLAAHLGVDLAQLRKFNPALRPPVFEGQKYIPRGYKLRLPSDSAKYAGLASDIPDDIFSPKQKRSQFYRVRRGDTAGAIARMHGVSINELVIANQLNRRATIYAGQNLRIPALGDHLVVLNKAYKTMVAPQAGPASSEPVQIAMLEESSQELITPVPEAQQTVAESSPVLAVVDGGVESGGQEEPAMQEEKTALEDSGDEGGDFTDGYYPDGQEPLFDIKDLVFAGNNNHIRPPLLAPTGFGDDEADRVDDAGLLLLDINPQVVVGQLQVSRVYSRKGRTYGAITVEAEETLGHYADWLGIPTWQIRRQNGLRYGESIMVGQKIKIPIPDGMREVFEEKRYEFHKELIEDFFAAYRVDKIRKYKVRSGDNIWTLCRDEFDLPFWLVRQYNQSLKPTGLKPAQELLIPVVSRRQTEIANLAPEKNAKS